MAETNTVLYLVRTLMIDGISSINQLVWELVINCIPGSSKCVKFVPFHPKNLPKGRNFTYMEDPGIYICTSILLFNYEMKTREVQWSLSCCEIAKA